MKYFDGLKKQIKDIHTRKPYIEFLTAILTIPVLLTVIILNFNNLKGADASKEATKNETIVITQPANNNETKEIVVTKPACEPGIGDISITNPDEGDTITENPVMVDVDYTANGKCEVVWSYRINDGAWSNYDDRSISLSNLNNGDIKLDLRIKSVVNSDQKTLTRRFTYQGQLTSTPSPTSTPTPTSM